MPPANSWSPWGGTMSLSHSAGNPARIRFQELGHVSEEVIPDMTILHHCPRFLRRLPLSRKAGTPHLNQKFGGVACLAVAAASRWIQQFTCTRIPFAEGAWPRIFGWESRSASHSRRKQTVPMQLLSSGHVWHKGCARSKLEDKIFYSYQLCNMLLAKPLCC